MKMTELFADKYSNQKDRIPSSFKAYIRQFGDCLTMTGLKLYGITSIEIKEEVDAKLIQYEPNVRKGFSGYRLTTKGIEEVYRRVK